MSTHIIIPLRIDKNYPSNTTIRRHTHSLMEEIVESVYGKYIITYTIKHNSPLFKLKLHFHDNTSIIISVKQPSLLQLKKTDAYTLLQTILNHLQKQGLIFGNASDFFNIHIKKNNLSIEMRNIVEQINNSIEISFDQKWGLEKIVTTLQCHQRNHQQFAHCHINGIMLCSSGLTLDKAYRLITSMSKTEYEKHWEKEKEINRMINGFPKN